MIRSRLKVIPLGGLGEIGKNMLVLEYDRDIIVIDAGLMFPEEEMLGIDIVIPDMTYLVENKDRVRGIFVTHGHEDHIGAMSYLLQQVSAPVYSTRLTEGLIRVKLKENKALLGAKLNVVTPGGEVQAGRFRVEFFPVCHSIPDAVGMIINTPVGVIVHRSQSPPEFDWKTMRSPCGDHTGLRSSLPRVSWVSPIPSVPTVQIVPALRSSWMRDSNTMVRPSGDIDGAYATLPGRLVTRRRPVPSGRIHHTSLTPLMSDRNTIALVVAFQHADPLALLAASISTRAAPPAAGATAIADRPRS